jgi:hypothetical protein
MKYLAGALLHLGRERWKRACGTSPALYFIWEGSDGKGPVAPRQRSTSFGEGRLETDWPGYCRKRLPTSRSIKQHRAGRLLYREE